MAKTASDLAKQTLRELVKLDAIEEPSSEDSTYIQELSESYHETLVAFKVNVTWDYESIPLKVFMPLAGVLADVAARSFGVSVNPIESDRRLSLLKQAAANPYLGTVTKAEYF